MKIRDYMQLVCPIENKDLFRLAAAHIDDGKAWDTQEYTTVWPTANNGAYIWDSYPAGDNAQAIVSGWINEAVPSSSALFDVFRMDRGPNRALTNAELDLLRSVVDVYIQQDPETFLEDNGYTRDEPTGIGG